MAEYMYGPEVAAELEAREFVVSIERLEPDVRDLVRRKLRLPPYHPITMPRINQSASFLLQEQLAWQERHLHPPANPFGGIFGFLG